MSVRVRETNKGFTTVYVVADRQGDIQPGATLSKAPEDESCAFLGEASWTVVRQRHWNVLITSQSTLHLAIKGFSVVIPLHSSPLA